LLRLIGIPFAAGCAVYAAALFFSGNDRKDPGALGAAASSKAEKPLFAYREAKKRKAVESPARSGPGKKVSVGAPSPEPAAPTTVGGSISGEALAASPSSGTAAYSAEASVALTIPAAVPSNVVDPQVPVEARPPPPEPSRRAEPQPRSDPQLNTVTQEEAAPISPSNATQQFASATQTPSHRRTSTRVRTASLTMGIPATKKSARLSVMHPKKPARPTSGARYRSEPLARRSFRSWRLVSTRRTGAGHRVSNYRRGGSASETNDGFRLVSSQRLPDGRRLTVYRKRHAQLRSRRDGKRFRLVSAQRLPDGRRLTVYHSY
jgi:hypothetical protein